MTNKEAIEWIESLVETMLHETTVGPFPDPEYQDEVYEALDMAIKALKQEPILDKIRAEIEPTRKMYLEMNDIDWLNGCDYVLSVIDKYKAESEKA